MKSLFKHTFRDWLWLVGIAIFLILAMIVLYFVSAKEWKNVRVPLTSPYPNTESIAWDGSALGIVSYVSTSTPSWARDVYFLRMDPEGRVIVPPTKINLEFDQSYSNADIVWTGKEYGLVWVEAKRSQYGTLENCHVNFVRIDTNGVIQGDRVSVTVLESSCPYHVSIVWNGNGYGMAWDDGMPGDSFTKVYFARLNANGEKFGVPLVVNEASGIDPTVVWNGSEYGLIWKRRSWNGILFARLNAEGAKQGDEISLFQGSYRDQSIAVSNGMFGVVWDKKEGETFQVYLMTLDEEGNIMGERRLTSNPTGKFSFYPVIAGNRFGFGVAWNEWPNKMVHFKEVDIDGNELSPERTISEACDDSVVISLFPSHIIPINNSEYTVTWHDGPTVDGNLTYAVSKFRSLKNLWEWVKGRVF